MDNKTNPDNTGLPPETIELFLNVSAHKVDSLRVDRQENLRSITYYGTVVAVFLAFMKYSDFYILGKKTVFFALSYNQIAASILVLGAIGAAGVWMHVKELHMSELRVTGSLPGRLAKLTEGTFWVELSDVCGEQYRSFKKYELLFWVSYWVLSASVVGFVVSILCFLFLGPAPTGTGG